MREISLPFPSKPLPPNSQGFVGGFGGPHFVCKFKTLQFGTLKKERRVLQVLKNF